MRDTRVLVGMLLASVGFLGFALLLGRFGARNAPWFAVAALATLAVALGAARGHRVLAAAGAAAVATVFLYLQLSRPSFSLSLGTLGNLLIAGGAAWAAFSFARGERARLGWGLATLGGLVVIPVNIDAGTRFILAGLLATAGFAVAASTQRAWPEVDAGVDVNA